ncbi:MAG: hypothetical protein ACR2H9_21075, partial [Longimicrobiaceae bacterium]
RLRQGDIVANVPFVSVSVRSFLVINRGTGQPQQIDLVGTETYPASGSAIVAFECGLGIILNQSCDVTGALGRRRPILIARIRPMAEVDKKFGEMIINKRVNAIREMANPGKFPQAFYLPPVDAGTFTLEASTADLLDTTTIHPDDVLALGSLRRARLSVTALNALQERLAYCLGRFGAPDDLYFTGEERAAAEKLATEKEASRRASAEEEERKAAKRAAMGGKG